MAQFHMPRKIARGTTHHEARQELANECIELYLWDRLGTPN